MNSFKANEEFKINPNFNVVHIHTVNKKKIEEIANKLGYHIDYVWHPSYSEVFEEPKGNLKKIFFQESLILNDLTAAGPIYEKFLEEARNNPEYKKNVKRDYEKLNEEQDRRGITDEAIRGYEAADMEIWHEEEPNKAADKKMFNRHGGIIFLDSIQEQEYNKIMKWGYHYYSSRGYLVHLKNIKSEKPKVLLILEFGKLKAKQKINHFKINQTQWDKYLEILKKNLEN